MPEARRSASEGAPVSGAGTTHNPDSGGWADTATAAPSPLKDSTRRKTPASASPRGPAATETALVAGPRATGTPVDASKRESATATMIQ